MTREKETEQAANGYLDSLFGGGKHQDLYVMLFMAGAQWADQHLKDNLVDIDKACEWINDNYFEYLQPISYYEQLKNSIDINDFVNDFKKYAEEQL